MAKKTKEIQEETQSKGGAKLKIGIILVGLIAIMQLGVLIVIFKDPIVSTISGLIPEKVEEVLDYPLDSMQVNLADQDRDVFLRTTLSLRYTDAANTAILDSNILQMKARIIEILRSKKLSDIKTIEKTNQFAQYVADELNELLGQDIIKDVLFIEFLYQ